MNDRNSSRPTRSGISRLAHDFASYRRRQADLRRLQEMPDYLLKDIGISRGEVIAAVNRSRF